MSFTQRARNLWSTHATSVDKIIGTLDRIRDGHHYLWLLLLEIERWPLRLLVFLLPLFLQLPPVLSFLSSCFPSPFFNLRHISLPSQLPLPSLNLCFTLLQGNTGLTCAFSFLRLGLSSCKVSVGVCASVARSRIPIVCENVIVKCTLFSSCGGR